MLALCLQLSIFFLAAIVVNGEDFSIVVNGEAFNEKILAGYLDGINVELLDTRKAADTVAVPSAIPMTLSYDDISVSYFRPLQIYKNIRANLEPSTQTVDFVITNFVMTSKPFNMSLSYKDMKSIKCPGIAQVFISNYNISTSFNLYAGSSRSRNKSENEAIYAKDCALQIVVKPNAVKIDFAANDMPLKYAFRDAVCDDVFDNEPIEKAIRDFIAIFFKNISFKWARELNQDMQNMISKHQFLALRYDNVSTIEMVCYTNNSITETGNLQIEGLLISNKSVDWNGTDIYNWPNYTTPHISIPTYLNGFAIDMLASSGLVILLCCWTGCVCSVKFVIQKIKEYKAFGASSVCVN